VRTLTAKKTTNQKKPERTVVNTGAFRDSDADKIDFEGHLSPYAEEVAARYMHEHRILPDGGRRDPDNWKRGISLDSYIKSLTRHPLDLQRLHRDCRRATAMTSSQPSAPSSSTSTATLTKSRRPGSRLRGIGTPPPQERGRRRRSRRLQISAQVAIIGSDAPRT
jgi:hypothetical protein